MEPIQLVKPKIREFAYNTFMDYTSPPPKSGGNKTLTYVLIGVGASCLLLCGIGGFGIFNAAKGIQPVMESMGGCVMDGQMLQESFQAYYDKNGKYPDAKTWKEDIKPFFAEARKTSKEFKDIDKSPIKFKFSDIEGVWGCYSISEKRVNPFFYNSDLAGKKKDEIKDFNNAILIFEKPDAKNGAEPYVLAKTKSNDRVFGQPREWLIIPIVGEIKDGYDAGAGSPATR
jgi:hypothetical protein